MKLTIYFDGQLYVGIIETTAKNTLKAYRYIFGKEPNDQEVWLFVNQFLIPFMEKEDQIGIPFKEGIQRRTSPKRLQRIVAKETNHIGVSTKAQEAIKEQFNHRKMEKKKKSKILKEELKRYKREKKEQKAKKKHKGR